MTKWKIIFLDIDGVLNSTRSALALGGVPWMDEPHKWDALFDKIAVALLRRLVDETNAKVVLSSSWRIGVEPGEIPKLAQFLGVDIISYTDSLWENEYRRGKEVQKWLLDNDYDEENDTYVIIDDLDEWLPQQRNKLVLVSPANGFSAENYFDAANLLGVENPQPRIVLL